MDRIEPPMPEKSFVSGCGTDLCVICGCDTGIPTDTHVDFRFGYIEGSGQCCRECARLNHEL